MNETNEAFASFPKIPRLRNETVFITEKIDGTNAQVVIGEDGSVRAGSRNRWITPQDDNYGFAAWVEANKECLRGLGVGRHFGEWYGNGIQRNYGLKEKRFAIFNSYRPDECLPPCVGVVTTLYSGSGMGLSDIVARLIADLNENGSRHVPGFGNPEGLVVYSMLTKCRYKVLCENDEGHKGIKP